MRGRGWVAGGAAVAVLAGAAFGWAAWSRPRVTLLAGYAVEGGRVVEGDEGAVLRFSEGTVPRLTLRLPVRNDGHRPLTVTYPSDVSVPYSTRWPHRTLRLAPGETGWLLVGHEYHGCAAQRAREGQRGGWQELGGVSVTLHSAGRTAETELLLPVPLRVPQVYLPPSCWQSAP